MLLLNIFKQQQRACCCFLRFGLKRKGATINLSSYQKHGTKATGITYTELPIVLNFRENGVTC
jgi:hypothetical protein